MTYPDNSPGSQSNPGVSQYDLGTQIGAMRADIRVLKEGMDRHLRWHERPQNYRNGPVKVVVSGLPWAGGAGVVYTLLSVLVGG